MAGKDLEGRLEAARRRLADEERKIAKLQAELDAKQEAEMLRFSRLFTELMLNQARENERTREYFKKVLVGELESRVDIECTEAIWERFFGEAF